MTGGSKQHFVSYSVVYNSRIVSWTHVVYESFIIDILTYWY